MANPGVFTDGLSGKGSISNFTSDNNSYQVVLSGTEAAVHTHNFTYVSSGDNTIIATCSTAGCGLTDSKATLTITPPASGGGAAVLSGDTDAFTISGDITYSQKSGSTWSTPTNTVPSTNGFFRASVTINTGGSETKTISVTYGVNAITVQSGITHGTITAPAVATVGAVVPITISPETGYVLDTLIPTKINGGASIAVTNQSFIMPDEEVTVNATFKLADYNISCNITNGAITLNSPTAHYNDKLRIVVNPDYGYGIESINVQGITLNLISLDINTGVEVYELTMPNNNISVNVELAERTIYTIFYKAADSTTSVLYRFHNSDNDSYTMRSDAKMGDVACWAGQVNAAVGRTSLPISFNVNGGGWGALTDCPITTDLSSINSMADGSAVLIPGDDKAFIASFRAGAYDTDANGNITVRENFGNKNYFVSSNTTDISVPIPTKTNYDFMGWSYEDQNGEAKTIAPGSGSTVTVAINGNINKTTIFNAVWQRSRPLIVYDLNGGSWNRTNHENVTYGEKLAKPADPTREGYAFNGWVMKTDSKGMRGNNEITLSYGSNFDFDTTKVIDTIRLKARWKHVHSFAKIPLSKINDVMPGALSQTYIDKYNTHLHFKICSLADSYTFEAHEFDKDGKCVCGFDINTSEVTLEISYNNREDSNPFKFQYKRNSNVNLTAPILGTDRFVKWEYRSLNGTEWKDLAEYPDISFPIPGSIRVNAVYQSLTKPELTLKAENNKEDSLLFTMSYTLPTDCTAKSAIIAFGDNYMLWYRKVVREFIPDPPTTADMLGTLKDTFQPKNILSNSAKLLGEFNDMTNKIINSTMDVVGIEDPTIRNMISFTANFVIASATGGPAAVAGMLVEAGVKAVGLEDTVVGEAINLATSIATGDVDDIVEITGNALTLASDIAGESSVSTQQKGHYEVQYWVREDNLLDPANNYKVQLMSTMMQGESVTLPGHNRAKYETAEYLGKYNGFAYTGYKGIKDAYDGNRYYYVIGWVLYTEDNSGADKLAVVGPFAVTYNQAAAKTFVDTEVSIIDAN